MLTSNLHYLPETMKQMSGLILWLFVLILAAFQILLALFQVYSYNRC